MGLFGKSKKKQKIPSEDEFREELKGLYNKYGYKGFVLITKADEDQVLFSWIGLRAGETIDALNRAKNELLAKL